MRNRRVYWFDSMACMKEFEEMVIARLSISHVVFEQLCYDPVLKRDRYKLIVKFNNTHLDKMLYRDYLQYYY